MKKIYILAAIALVAGVSCTKQVPVTDNSPDVPLSFNVVTSPNTKTVYGEIDASYDTNEQFVVYAGWTAEPYNTTAPTEFFDPAETCTYDGTAAWKPAHTYYWPKSGYLTFEAFSPAAAASKAGHTWNGGFTFTDFEVPATIATQYDLMYSNRTFDKKRGDFGITDGSYYDDETDGTYTYNGVNLMFNHILSSIKFKVKTSADYSGNNTVITLTGLTIKNAYSVGDFTEGITTAAPAASFAKSPAWSGQETEVNYTIVNGGTQVVASGTAQDLAGDPDIILLPQALGHTTNDVIVTVNYTISQNGGTPIAQTSNITLKKLESSGSAIDAWELGKRYTYTIVFGLEEIYFDPAVTAWTDDVTVDPYLIPYISIAISASPTGNIAVTGTTTLTATVTPASASNTNVTWATSDATIAAITASTGTTATIEGVAPGTATITATSVEDPQVKTTYTVTVE